MKKIIWIEDDTDIIDLVVRPLERSNYQIKRLDNVQKALENIEEIRQCDLILLDLIIPLGGTEDVGDYPGIYLLRTFREKYKITQPVIVLSVVADLQTFDELKKLNTTVANKPILPSKLKILVDQVLGVEE